MDEALEAVAAAAGQALPAAPSEPGLVRFYGHSRAFLKVADGCPGGCTYCIIPRLRGPLKSRPPDEIVAEAGRLVTSGHNEIVLTAIHLGLYGTDLVPSLRLWDLTARVLKEGRLRRLRLSSLEVSELTPPLVAAVAGHPRMANHLHIPLQSGDDGVLHRMGRSYTADQYRQALANLRRAAPHVSVSTDVIAGFPGESEQSFEATLSFVEEAEFSRLHAFPFSPRPGTEAADFDGTVPDSVKTRRIARLVEAGRRSARAFRRRFVGRTLEVLVERVRETPDGLELRGLSSEYIPVRFPGPPSRIGDVVAVTIADEDPDGLLGDMHTENR
jgi:threonylcarbamoyladenosine tRNA methylthiotransferase MtaB